MLEKDIIAHSSIQCLREENLKFKLQKCSFFQFSILYLGHIVSRDGMAVDPSKIEKVQCLSLLRRSSNF